MGLLAMIMGLFWMAAANTAVLAGSVAILRRVRTGDGILDFGLFLLIRIILISGSVLIAGLTGTLTPSGIGMPACVLLLALWFTGQHRPLPAFRMPDLGRPLAILLILLLVRLLVQVWFVAPHLGDPLAYQLPKIAEWIRAGGFTREMGMHPHATFPAGFELIETWWVVFVRHDLLIEMAGVEFVVLGCISTVALARHLDISERWAWFTGLLFCVTPTFIISSISCLNDVPVSSLLITTMVLAVRRAHPALLLSAAGLGLGIKPTYGFALPGVVLLWYLSRKEEAPRLERVPVALALAGVALITGAYWYVRNLSWFGNPFYPLGTPGFVDPTPVQFGPGFSSLVANLSDLINHRIQDSKMSYGPNTDYGAGWGAAAYACGGIALMDTLKSDPRLRRLFLAIGAMLLCTLTMVQNDPWNLKYLSYVPVIFCLATLKLRERLPGIGILALVAFSFSFIGTIFNYDLRPEHVRALAAQPWVERSAAVLPYGEMTLDPPEDVIGYYGGPTGASYLLYKPDFSRRVVYLRASTLEELLRAAQEAQLTTIFAPRATRAQRQILENGTSTGSLKLVSGAFYSLE